MKTDTSFVLKSGHFYLLTTFPTGPPHFRKRFPDVLRVKVRSFCAGLFLLCSNSATAQVVGEFYLDKETFAVGEPIFVTLRLVNKGQDTVKLCPADHAQPYCSHVSIDISTDPPPVSSCPSYTNSCMFDGSLCSPTPLVPGEYRADRFLLNYDYEINAPVSIHWRRSIRVFAITETRFMRPSISSWMEVFRPLRITSPGLANCVRPTAGNTSKPLARSPLWLRRHSSRNQGEIDIWRKQRAVKVVVTPNGMHYIFLSNEAEILSLIIRFVDGLPRSETPH